MSSGGERVFIVRESDLTIMSSGGESTGGVFVDQVFLFLKCVCVCVSARTCVALQRVHGIVLQVHFDIFLAGLSLNY